ncbi:hypothetical protein BV97_01916 [Novosphingobium resinovorum]|uniref:Lipoprotein n=1 Tax=Novosphingobium resinovorum TaxID=158500 RepID=A0A031JZQ7_9SPHN|nr:hypothetical protein [Novosphingobium resinovorum]EZP82419.1 hypothetical protein BV97_01916 [Novosphingobium resinovorum]
MRWRNLIGAIGMCGTLAACSQPADTDQFAAFYEPYRFRLSVAVETPEGPKVGSGVIEVRWSDSSFKVTGEAVPIDLPNGETLFVLLQSRGDVDWASKSVDWIPEDLRKTWVMPDSDGETAASERGKFFWQKVAAFRGTVSVPRTRKSPVAVVDNYPLIVRFRDVNDPSTVEEVSPKNFAKILGAGYGLTRITATFTDNAVSRGIRKRLSWIDDYDRRDSRLNGSTSTAIWTNDLSDNLEAGAFIAGNK